MTVLYAVTMGVSGALLFLVQPMFAKMLLPRFGGAPAVWNTAMLFYQLALLAGYLYAHGVRRWLSPTAQVLMHCVVIALPVLVLPMHLTAGGVPLGGEDPVPTLLALMCVGVGLPFFVVSATSPLLQAWFGTLGGQIERDPYPLYAASNVGSMVSLVAYPFVIEPRVALPTQSAAWSVGYAVLACLLLACGIAYVRNAPSHSSAPAATAAMSEASAPVTWTRRGRWVALAFVPSSLMLSVTTYMATNIAPVPLLWIIPLALYLLTFIVAFSARRRWRQDALRRAFPLLLLPVLALALSGAAAPIRLLIVLHLLGFVLLAFACHAELAVDAPASSALTEFYLWLSVGGALGGVFNAIAAPRLFASVLEYPLVIALAGLVMRPALSRQPRSAADGPRALSRDVALPLAVSAIVLLVHAGASRAGGMPSELARITALAIGALLCLPMAGRQLRFGLGAAGLVLANTMIPSIGHVMYEERSFFGISRVSGDGTGRFHQLAHGSITHGAQDVRTPSTRREPLTYYSQSGPVGHLMRTLRSRGRALRVGAVGLGAGSVACYAQPGDRWTFFEIDPVVVRIARDARYFTYLQDCAPNAGMVVGDARLSLAGVADSSFDLLLLDAYSADAIPLHLLTREAMQLYRRTVAPDGVLAFHVSNNYFDLEPVVQALAVDAGLQVRVFRDVTLTADDRAMGKTQSVWMIVAQPRLDLAAFDRDPAWRSVGARSSLRVWTDDFASALSALR